MNVIKKTTTMVLSLCLAFCAITPLKTSAYICGDVDNSGSISVLDVVNLNKYLAGMVELVDYSAADVTGNYVINVIDAEVLQKYITGNVTSLPCAVPGE